jgi:hypothetical protein
VRPATTGQLFELGATGEPGREHDCYAAGVAYGGNELLLGDRHGTLVLALFHPQFPASQ